MGENASPSGLSFHFIMNNEKCLNIFVQLITDFFFIYQRTTIARVQQVACGKVWTFHSRFANLKIETGKWDVLRRAKKDSVTCKKKRKEMAKEKKRKYSNILKKKNKQ